MRLPFTALPLPDQHELRPVLDVVVEQLPFPLACLVDSGSLRTRLPGWVADELGFNLGDAPCEDVVLGGTRTLARQAHVVLGVRTEQVPCPVWFCDGWRPVFGLLGQEDFLRLYRLTMSAAEGWFTLAREA